MPGRWSANTCIGGSIGFRDKRLLRGKGKRDAVGGAASLRYWAILQRVGGERADGPDTPIFYRRGVTA
jgi:hypothetical protein